MVQLNLSVEQFQGHLPAVGMSFMQDFGSCCASECNLVGRRGGNNLQNARGAVYKGRDITSTTPKKMNFRLKEHDSRPVESIFQFYYCF